MLDWDREGRFRFAALQSEAGRALLRRAGRSPDDISSIVLVERRAAHTKSAAILRIAAGLQAPLPLVAAALDTFPRPFKDWFYDQVGPLGRLGCDPSWRHGLQATTLASFWPGAAPAHAAPCARHAAAACRFARSLSFPLLLARRLQTTATPCLAAHPPAGWATPALMTALSAETLGCCLASWPV